MSASSLANAAEAAGFVGARGRARLALEVGVDAVTVWRWLTGRSIPTGHATRERLAAALELRADDLPTTVDQAEAA